MRRHFRALAELNPRIVLAIESSWSNSQAYLSSPGKRSRREGVKTQNRNILVNFWMETGFMQGGRGTEKDDGSRHSFQQTGPWKSERERRRMDEERNNSKTETGKKKFSRRQTVIVGRKSERRKGRRKGSFVGLPLRVMEEMTG